MARLCSLCFIFFLSVIHPFFPAHAGELEVLHWWKSKAGGELRSLEVLKSMFEAEGHQWKDLGVSGGGGSNAMAELYGRLHRGTLPSVAQVKGPQIQYWGKQNLLTPLDGVASEENWDKFLPRVVGDTMKVSGRYVAVPLNVHRINWMWVNPKIFAQLGISIPRTWQEFFEVADKIKQAGFIPLAHGNEDWQTTTMFESIVLGMSSSRFYKEAFVELNPEAWKSDTMVKAFELLKRLKPLSWSQSQSKLWHDATGLLIDGNAAMQFMGDWAKGEFTAAHKVPGVDYLCMPVPQTQGQFIYNIDSFIMIKTADSAIEEAQKTLARLVLEPEFQLAFSQSKGSIPVRLGLSRAKIDHCAQQGLDDFVLSAATNNFVPSMAHEMSTFPSIRSLLMRGIQDFFDSSQSAEAATLKIAEQLKGLKALISEHEQAAF